MVQGRRWVSISSVRALQGSLTVVVVLLDGSPQHILLRADAVTPGNTRHLSLSLEGDEFAVSPWKALVGLLGCSLVLVRVWLRPGLVTTSIGLLERCLEHPLVGDA